MKRFFVYILATRKDGPLYVGITNNLQRRVFEHKSHVIRGFTAKYNIDRLVWFEMHDNPEAAIQREANQTVASRVEERIDRSSEPRMARLVRHSES